MSSAPSAARWIGPFSPLGLWIALIVFVADQAHKAWMVFGYRIAEKGRVYVTPFLDWYYVRNQGISYGLFQQGDWRGQVALALFAVVVSIAMAIWLARAVDTKVLAASVGLIIGGALGNAVDRVLHGGVVDYVSMHAFGYYWYVFNIADVAIVAGVIGLLYDSVVSNQSAVKSP